MRFKAFNARYKALARPMKNLHRIDSKSVEDCEFILDCYNNQLKNLPNENMSNNNKDWAHGRKHIFLSEGARQQLEMLRESRRQKARYAQCYRMFNLRYFKRGNIFGNLNDFKQF